MHERRSPRALLIYHFFHPDEVVSARLFTDLALGLRDRGWGVTALTSNRVWSSPRTELQSRESHEDVDIRRAFRPAWDQARPLERLANSVWLSAAWLARIARLPKHDAVVIGSDPAFSPALLPAIRRLWPRAMLAHWCFDLFPEAIAADQTSRSTRALFPLARRLMSRAYAACDAIVDLGPRMRERLAEYPSRARRETIAPWALVESSGAPARPDPAVRRALFGDAKLALLYSGTLGRAHDYETFIALARAARERFGRDVAFTFACRGNRVPALRAALGPSDVNIRVADFCDEAQLPAQLESADLHLLSLQQEWSGLVVPSKFFGSLAAGRPVLYAGPRDSDIARYIAESRVGSAIERTQIPTALDWLERLVANRDVILDDQRRASASYDARFRKSLGIDRWHAFLKLAVAPAFAHEPNGIGVARVGR